MNPKVSIVIPTYNSSQYISEALDSVLAQTYKDYEIIVVDDGSTDDTIQALQPYMSRIKYIYKENGGPGSARNVGIRNAQGEYIAFLDSDDLWLPEKLEKQVRYLERYPEISLVFTDCLRLEENSLRRSKRRKFISDDMLVSIWWENLIVTSTVMVRKYCFERIGTFDESGRMAEDLEMWLRIIANGYRVSFLDEILAVYRVRLSGHRRSNVDRAYYTTRQVLEKYYNIIKQYRRDAKKLYKRRFLRLHFEHGLAYFCINMFQNARKQLKAALRYKTFNLRTVYALSYYLATFLHNNQIELIRKIKRRISKLTAVL